MKNQVPWFLIAWLTAATGVASLEVAGALKPAREESPWPDIVKVLDVGMGHNVSVTGFLGRGERIARLALPDSCIAEVNRDEFGGNHVLFGAVLPEKADMTIVVVPEDETTQLSVYAYLMPTDHYDLPDTAADVSTCKSSTREGVRSQRLLKLTGGQEPQNVMIGVASASPMGRGTFLLNVDIR